MNTHSVEAENANTSLRKVDARKAAMEIFIGLVFGFHMADLDWTLDLGRIFFRGWKARGKHRIQSECSMTKQDGE